MRFCPQLTVLDLAEPREYPHDLIFADRAAGWSRVRQANRTFMRESGASLYASGRGFLVLSDHDDVAEALCNRDLTTFTGLRVGGEFVATTDVARRVLRRAITAGTAKWVDTFTDAAAGLIDTVAASGGCDVMREVAWPLGGHLFAAMCEVDIAEFSRAAA
ncbi:cytochrome P450 [Mycobacterium timonense]|uniref:Cytochrome P450 n=1 Tax=Mycobacterium timonense TaxID=701043 RepID=A0A7I9Z089_9MYCO|nr:cytochrome P450 [Mycobacterium timonense]GFG94285.1 hypothetical protein MTIM_01640 [Mycobacterium timonense]